MKRRRARPAHQGERQRLWNRRVPVWMCQKCRRWHEKDGELPQVPRECAGCGCTALWYFASRAQARRAAELLLQQDHDLITHLRMEPVFRIKVNGVEVTTYRADFEYRRRGEVVIEDVKGSGSEKYDDELFKLKRKLVAATFGAEVTTVRG